VFFKKKSKKEEFAYILFLIFRIQVAKGIASWKLHRFACLTAA